MSSYKDFFVKKFRKNWRVQPKNVFKIIPNAVRRAWGLAARLNKVNVRGKEHK